MGRNKYSRKEIDEIGRLLKLKCKGNRFQQKQVRHVLRTEYEFSISDFNEQGKPFGYDELQEALKHWTSIKYSDVNIDRIDKLVNIA